MRVAVWVLIVCIFLAFGVAVLQVKRDGQPTCPARHAATAKIIAAEAAEVAERSSELQARVVARWALEEATRIVEEELSK